MDHLARIRDLVAARKRLEKELPQAVVAARRAGVSQKDVAEALEVQREQVRRIERQTGLQATR